MPLPLNLRPVPALVLTPRFVRLDLRGDAGLSAPAEEERHHDPDQRPEEEGEPPSPPASPGGRTRRGTADQPKPGRAQEIHPSGSSAS